MTAFKYDEDRHLKEISDHIEKTYGGHYVGKDNVQSMDLILATGHGLGFTLGNAIKYMARYGKKAGRNKADLLKAAHYIVLALHEHDRDVGPKEEKTE